MKALLWITSFLLLSLSGLPAQPPHGQQQRVRAMKVAFITDRMRLTPEEAQKFWPIYNQYEAELSKIREKHRLGRDLSTLSDAELERFLNNFLDMEEQQVTLKRDYFSRMKQAVGLRKVALFIESERDFNRKLIQTIQKQGPPDTRK